MRNEVNAVMLRGIPSMVGKADFEFPRPLLKLLRLGTDFSTVGAGQKEYIEIKIVSSPPPRAHMNTLRGEVKAGPKFHVLYSLGRSPHKNCKNDIDDQT